MLPGGMGQGSRSLPLVPRLCQQAQPIPALASWLQKPTATPSPQAGSSREAGHCSVGAQLCTQLHSPVSDPARVAMGALAVDVVAGVAILAGGTELLAALSVEAG